MTLTSPKIKPVYSMALDSLNSGGILFPNPYYYQGRRRGSTGTSAPPSFQRGARASEVPFLNCFYSKLAIIFQPENTTEGTLCSKLTEIHLIALPPYQ